MLGFRTHDPDGPSPTLTSTPLRTAAPTPTRVAVPPPALVSVLETLSEPALPLEPAQPPPSSSGTTSTSTTSRVLRELGPKAKSKSLPVATSISKGLSKAKSKSKSAASKSKSKLRSRRSRSSERELDPQPERDVPDSESDSDAEPHPLMIPGDHKTGVPWPPGNPRTTLYFPKHFVTTFNLARWVGWCLRWCLVITMAGVFAHSYISLVLEIDSPLLAIIVGAYPVLLALTFVLERFDREKATQLARVVLLPVEAGYELLVLAIMGAMWVYDLVWEWKAGELEVGLEGVMSLGLRWGAAFGKEARKPGRVRRFFRKLF